jgi:aspartate/methionine/tyrosine aminotransferase
MDAPVTSSACARLIVCVCRVRARRSDWALCRWLAKEARVVAIPPSPFYSPPHKHLAANFARFAFCKVDENLTDAERQLKQFFKVA